MRIGVDARKISDTGIGSYIQRLIPALLAAEPEHRYVLFMAPEDVGSFLFPAGRVETVPASAGKYSLREHWALGALARRAGVELFHEPHFTLPLYMPCKRVVTIHDVIHLLDPAVGAIQKKYARWMISSALKRADQIITVSHHSQRNLVEMFGADPAKITVTHNAPDPALSPMGRGELAAELARLNLTPGYFLFVGSDRPHKNIKAVAAAMALMAEDTRFVIVGRVGPPARAPFGQFGGRVSFVGQVGTHTIAALYSGAQALFFPSYLEGFGLPPIEAMALQTPVVAANRSCIPEVTGDAAALVDPDDARSAAMLLERIRSDQTFRSALVEKGIKRAASFSWKTAAQATLAVYERAMK
jgi:alpha-1,3-rhamnosyl/mannosyltransferase